MEIPEGKCVVAEREKCESKKEEVNVAVESKNRKLREVSLLNVGGGVFGCRKRPPPSFFIIWCRGCSPRRANLPIFFYKGKHNHGPIYRLAFAYSNLLKLDQASITYFKQTIVIITVNSKDTGLPCSDVLCLSNAGKGRRSVGHDPILHLHPSLSTCK